MGAFNWLLENLDPLAQLLLQALLKTLWQGLLITALVWLLLRIFKQASATTRHAVWLVTLLIITALPLVAIATKRDAQLQSSTVSSHQPDGSLTLNSQTRNSLPPNPVQLNNLVNNPVEAAPIKTAQQRIFAGYDRAAQVDQTSRMLTLAEAAKVTHPAMIQPSTVAKKSLRQRASEWFSNDRWPVALPELLIALWLMVGALMLARIIHSYYTLFCLRRSLDAALAEQQGRAQYLAELFGIRRPVELFTSPRVKMPMTIGSSKPLIILPSDLARALASAEFDSVVAHELAHIKRWDYLTNLLQRLAQALLFFHPAVWFIGRQLMIERELACDDWAVKMCEPRRYASCLTRLVEILSDSRPLAAAAGILFGKHVISRRVEMILNRDRNATTAVSKSAVVYAVGLAAMLVAACSLLSPVIAIPLGQQAKKQKKEVKVTTPAISISQPVPPPPPAPEAPEAPPVLFELADTPEAPPLPPEPEIAALDQEAALWVQDGPHTPAAPLAPAPAIPPARVSMIGGIQGGVATTAPLAPVAEISQLPPGAVTISGWGQDDKNKAPAIPEAELLSLLTDIVKRDSDPQVRNEALQGIYRLRSDAATNTLLLLYDGVTDPKTKGEIIAYLLRRTGDNSRAIAKLTQIAKSDSNEELRNRAIRYLGSVKGDEGASNLISIYDGLQDAKMKQYVIRSLASNKSSKAIEKLKQIAKSDADPAIRSAAIRSLYSVDSRLYMDTIPPGGRVGLFDGGFKFETPRAFEFDEKQFQFQFNSKQWEEAQREWQEKWKENQGKYRELIEKMQIEGLDKLKIEMPKIEIKLKELEEKLKSGQDLNLIVPKIENQLRGQISQVTSQLASLHSPDAATHSTVIETRRLLDLLQRQLNRAETIRRAPRPAVSPVDRVAPTPQPKPSQSIDAGARGAGTTARASSSL